MGLLDFGSGYEAIDDGEIDAVAAEICGGAALLAIDRQGARQGAETRCGGYRVGLLEPEQARSERLGVGLRNRGGMDAQRSGDRGRHRKCKCASDIQRVAVSSRCDGGVKRQNAHAQVGCELRQVQASARVDRSAPVLAGNRTRDCAVLGCDAGDPSCEDGVRLKR